MMTTMMVTAVEGETTTTTTTSQSDLTKYNYMCDDCGEAFYSLNEYIEHYKHYHPSSIGTAIT